MSAPSRGVALRVKSTRAMYDVMSGESVVVMGPGPAAAAVGRVSPQSRDSSRGPADDLLGGRYGYRPGFHRCPSRENRLLFVWLLVFRLGIGAIKLQGRGWCALLTGAVVLGQRPLALPTTTTRPTAIASSTTGKLRSGRRSGAPRDGAPGAEPVNVSSACRHLSRLANRLEPTDQALTLGVASITTFFRPWRPG